MNKVYKARGLHGGVDSWQYPRPNGNLLMNAYLKCYLYIYALFTYANVNGSHSIDVLLFVFYHDKFFVKCIVCWCMFVVTIVVFRKKFPLVIFRLSLKTYVSKCVWHDCVEETEWNWKLYVPSILISIPLYLCNWLWYFWLIDPSNYIQLFLNHLSFNSIIFLITIAAFACMFYQ